MWCQQFRSGSEVPHHSEHLANSEKVTGKLSENLVGWQELTADQASSQIKQHPELRIHWQRQRHQGVCGWAFSANAFWDSEYKTATAVTTVAAAAAMDAAALAAAAAVTDAAAALAVTLAGANSALAVTLAGANSALGLILAGANSALAHSEQCPAAAAARSWQQQQQAAVHVALGPSAADVILDFVNPDADLHLRAQPADVAFEQHQMAYLHLHCLVLAAVIELHADCHHQTGC